MLREALTEDRLRAMEPDEAAGYFASYAVDGLTPNERELMGSWLSANVAHAAALERAQRSWNVFEDADHDEILTEMRDHARAGPAARWHVPRRALAAAAAVLFLVIAGSLFLLPRAGRPPSPVGAEGAAIEYASTPTQTREVVLPDGSRMTLDANSTVRGRFSVNSRSLSLIKGRAYFDVLHDVTRPFTVTARDRRIVDLGTRFSAGVVDGSLHVLLLRGSVSIESLKPGVPSVSLKPGEEFVETASGPIISKVGDGDAATGWRQGLIALDDAKLGDAVAQFNRYSRLQIVVRDPRVAAMRVSGQFRATDAERFARTVAELHPVRVVRKGDTIELVAPR